MEPATMDAHTAATYLGISRRTLSRLIQRGELPVVRVGRRVLLRRVALEAFLRAREHGGARADEGDADE